MDTYIAGRSQHTQRHLSVWVDLDKIVNQNLTTAALKDVH